MITILLSSLVTVLAFTLNKQIRKYFKYILPASIVLAVALYLAGLDIVTMGFLGLAFFVVVMYGGAFPRKSKTSKIIRSIRKEYSILGFVFLAPHAFEYLLQFLNGTFSWEWYGVVGFIIMIPLFITSFSVVKKKMDTKTWFKLQRFAYVVYLLIFVHLLVIGQADHIPVYIAIFGVYTFLKLYNYTFKKTDPIGRVFLSVIVVLVGMVVSFKVSGYEPQELFGDINISSYGYEGLDFGDLELTDGTYTGTASGFQNLTVEVEVTVLNGEVTEIVLIDDGSTSPHKGIDFEQVAIDIAEDIVSSQSTDIDTYSGATSTSKGVLEAVEDAINE